ncbi:hypothetical protein [Candidatus Poriferisodalis sp.]
MIPAEGSRLQLELRLITGADHRIRHDPRAVAILLGWLEHQAAAQYA